MYCKKCGAEMDDGVQFCPKCGQSVSEAARQPTAGTEKSVLLKKFGMKKSFVGYMVALSIFMLIFGFIIMEYMGFDKMPWGWDHSSTTAKLYVISGGGLSALGILELVSIKKITSETQISVCDNRVYGTFFPKFSYHLHPVTFSVTYDEIIGVTYEKKGIVLDTITGTHNIHSIESAEECVEMIKSRMKEK